MLADKDALFSSKAESARHGDTAMKQMRWGGCTAEILQSSSMLHFFHLQCLLSEI